MATFVETFDRYKSEMSSLGIVYDENLFEKVTKELGPIIYNHDVSRVSCTDSEEMARIKNSFLMGKHGLSNSPALDEAIKDVCAQLGSSNPNKFLAMFCYLLVVRLGLEARYR